MKNSLIAAALVSTASLAAPAFAATINGTVLEGQTFCESENSIDTSIVCTAGGSADLSNSASTPDTLNFKGSGTLAGFVADAAGINPNRYPDFATITLNGASRLTFSLVNPTTDFDALFSFGDLASLVVDTENSSATFLASAGDFLFGINAAAATDSITRQESSYTLEVAAVPLPASVLFLLAGLGGLGAVRRKRAS